MDMSYCYGILMQAVKKNRKIRKQNSDGSDCRLNKSLALTKPGLEKAS